MENREYRIKHNCVADYELNILKSGICPSLIESSFYFEEDDVVIICNSNNYSCVGSILSRSEREVLKAFKSSLEIVRSAIEASQICKQYLIKLNDISFDPDNLYFDSDGKVHFMLTGHTDSLEPDIQQIAAGLAEKLQNEFPYTNAGVISEKINGEYKNMNCWQMLKMLSLWQMELE